MPLNEFTLILSALLNEFAFTTGNPLANETTGSDPVVSRPKVSNIISKSCIYRCRKAGLRQIIYIFFP